MLAMKDSRYDHEGACTGSHFTVHSALVQLSWVSASYRDKAQDAFIYVQQMAAGPILSY
jgi:hypothetical protein